MFFANLTEFLPCRYFRKDNLYGLACFEKMRVESEIERGARMKSVGILSTSYTLLYRHMQFLETQVRYDGTVSQGAPNHLLFYGTYSVYWLNIEKFLELGGKFFFHEPTVTK